MFPLLEAMPKPWFCWEILVNFVHVRSLGPLTIGLADNLTWIGFGLFFYSLLLKYEHFRQASGSLIFFVHCCPPRNFLAISLGP